MPFMQYIKWGGIVVALIALLSFWMKYNSVVSERDTLAQNNTILQNSFELQKASIDTLNNQVDKAYNAIESLGNKVQEMVGVQQDARKELEVLNGKFRNHNLEALAKKKPGLIKKRLNDGTYNTFRMLEQSTEFRTDRSSGK